MRQERALSILKIVEDWNCFHGIEFGFLIRLFKFIVVGIRNLSDEGDGAMLPLADNLHNFVLVFDHCE